MKSIIEQIQDDDPSYNPLITAISKTPSINLEQWAAACDRIYIDGYFGPISDDEWREQDGREPSNINEAIKLIARVLDNVDSYEQYVTEVYEAYHDDCELGFTHEHEYRETEVDASEIRAALVPFYSEIYGARYPTL